MEDGRRMEGGWTEFWDEPGKGEGAVPGEKCEVVLQVHSKISSARDFLLFTIPQKLV
jgi:hypothetical protein